MVLYIFNCITHFKAISNTTNSYILDTLVCTRQMFIAIHIIITIVFFGTYTNILRIVLNIHWTNKIKNEILYGELEILSHEIIRRMLQFAGHANDEKTMYTFSLSSYP